MTRSVTRPARWIRRTSKTTRALTRFLLTVMKRCPDCRWTWTASRRTGRLKPSESRKGAPARTLGGAEDQPEDPRARGVMD